MLDKNDKERLIKAAQTADLYVQDLQDVDFDKKFSFFL